MSLVYFTNNADAGDGSLRDAIERAEPGDTIAPDPNVSWGTDTIEIALSSRLNAPKNLTFDASPFRVRLTGQKAYSCLSLSAGVAALFRRFDFVEGYNATGGGCFHLSTSASNVAFESCLFAYGFSGNYGGNVYVYTGTASFRDCVVVAGYSTLGGGGVRVGKLCRAFELIRCTLIGNASFDLSIAAEAPDPIIEDSVVGHATNQARVDASSIGAVHPPPDVLPSRAETDALWRSWDLRLREDSPYARGAIGAREGAVDFLGNARQPGGSLGAYEGTWLVVKEGETRELTDSLAVDRIDVGSNANVLLKGDALYLCARFGGVVANSTFSSEGRAYLAIPRDFELNDVILSNVVRCENGAGLASFSARAISPKRTKLEWTVSDPTRTIALEERVDGVWQTLAPCASGTELELDARSGRTSYRAFDGETFYYDDAWTVAGVQYRVVYALASASIPAQNWEVVVQTVSTTARVAPGQSVSILARIYDAFDVNAPLLNDGSNVKSARYTCYFNTNNLFEEEYAPVQGHEDVELGPEALLEALQISDAWTVDNVGYNLTITPDVRTAPLFERPGEYRIKVVVELYVGNPIVFYAPISVVE